MNTNHARKWEQYVTHTQVKEKKVLVKVHRQGWVTKGEKILYALVGSFLILAGFFIVSFSSSTDQLNREVQTLESMVQNQKVENEGLLFEIKELSRPERITKIAKENGLKIEDAEVKQAHALNN